jgi:hypothetical protein
VFITKCNTAVWGEFGALVGNAEPGELGNVPGELLVEAYFVSKYSPGALFTLASPLGAQFASPLLKMCLYRIGLFVSISKKYNHTHQVNSIPVLRLFDLNIVTLLEFVGS